MNRVVPLHRLAGASAVALRSPSAGVQVSEHGMGPVPGEPVGEWRAVTLGLQDAYGGRTRLPTRPDPS